MEKHARPGTIRVFAFSCTTANMESTIANKNQITTTL